MKITKLKNDASLEDIIKKLNEVIESMNAVETQVYIGDKPSAYDLNAIGKHFKKRKN